MHKVMSAEQTAANRRNARLSTGPKHAPVRSVRISIEHRGHQGGGVGT